MFVSARVAPGVSPWRQADATAVAAAFSGITPGPHSIARAATIEPRRRRKRQPHPQVDVGAAGADRCVGRYAVDGQNVSVLSIQPGMAVSASYVRW